MRDTIGNHDNLCTRGYSECFYGLCLYDVCYAISLMYAELYVILECPVLIAIGILNFQPNVYK